MCVGVARDVNATKNSREIYAVQCRANKDGSCPDANTYSSQGDFDIKAPTNLADEALPRQHMGTGLIIEDKR